MQVESAALTSRAVLISGKCVCALMEGYSFLKLYEQDVYNEVFYSRRILTHSERHLGVYLYTTVFTVIDLHSPRRWTWDSVAESVQYSLPIWVLFGLLGFHILAIPMVIYQTV